ncbi:hypothetical protein LTR81_024199, partial [Elasticomyces elasticus]
AESKTRMLVHSGVVAVPYDFGQSAFDYKPYMLQPAALIGLLVIILALIGVTEYAAHILPAMNGQVSHQAATVARDITNLQIPEDDLTRRDPDTRVLPLVGRQTISSTLLPKASYAYHNLSESTAPQNSLINLTETIPGGSTITAVQSSGEVALGVGGTSNYLNTEGTIFSTGIEDHLQTTGTPTLAAVSTNYLKTTGILTPAVLSSDYSETGIPHAPPASDYLKTAGTSTLAASATFPVDT